MMERDSARANDIERNWKKSEAMNHSMGVHNERSPKGDGGRESSEKPSQNTPNSEFPEGLPTRIENVLQERRFYPIKPKEKVFDEWGAVVHHMEEAYKNNEYQEKIINQEKMAKYRLDLEQQKRDQQERSRLAHIKANQISEPSFDKLVQEKDSLACIDRKKKAIDIMDENFKLKKRQMKECKEFEKIHNKESASFILEQQEQLRRKNELEKQQKQKIQSLLKNSYIQQEQQLRKKKDAEREKDIFYDKMHKNKLLDEDKDREKFFNILKEKQAAIDQRKQQALKNSPPKKYDSEEAYRRELSERAKQEAEREQKERESKMKANLSTKMELSNQVEQKAMLDKLKQYEIVMVRLTEGEYWTFKQYEESEYASYVKRKYALQEREEKERQEKARLARLKYKETLAQQIEESRKKKLFKDVMTEHERHINGLDLQAYEKMQADLHANVIGFHPTLPPIKHSHSDLSTPSPTKSPNETRAGKKIVIPGGEISFALSKNPPIMPNLMSKQSPSKLLEQAIKNMLDPSMAFMRNNTQNHAYGYKPRGENIYRGQLEVNKSFDAGSLSSRGRITPDESQHNHSFVKDRSLASIGKSMVMNTSTERIQQVPQIESESPVKHGRRHYPTYNIITNAMAYS